MNHNAEIIQAMLGVFLDHASTNEITDLRDQCELKIIEARGAADGESAGSWVIDGNTTREAAEKILKGIEDNDPEVLDALPAPRIGGEFADDATWEDIVWEELSYPFTDEQRSEMDFSPVEDAYRGAFQTAMESEVYTDAKNLLATEDA